MRILLTTDTVGGVWTFMQELATGLLERGHAVSVVALGRSPSPSQQAWCDFTKARCAENFEVVCSSAPLEWMENNAGAYEEGAGVILRAAESFQPDLLHSSQFCFGALPMAVPLLITAHSDVLSWAEACRPQGFAPSSWLATYVDLVGAGLQEAHAVAAPTQWMLRALRRQYADLPAIQAHVPNGRTLHLPPSALARKLQAVSVGRLWDEGKNVRMLAETHSPWPLLVAGDRQLGEAAVPEMLGRVRMLGPLDTAELLTLFRESSAYICTSIYEPFGLAPLEAALCGCALLLNDLPSLRELWGDAALYFRNAGELSALLQRLHSAPERLLAAQQSAGERARHFSAERMVDGYCALYEELLHADDGTTRELAYDAA